MTYANQVRFNNLIARYEAAIHSDNFNEDLVNKLAAQVEAVADEIGYTNHARLMALHTAAERASIHAACERPVPYGC